MQWDYCDLSKRQDGSLLLDSKARSYCSYLLRSWVAPSSVLWVVQEFFEIKLLDFGAKDLGKHTTKRRTSVLKIGFTPDTRAIMWQDCGLQHWCRVLGRLRENLPAFQQSRLKFTQRKDAVVCGRHREDVGLCVWQVACREHSVSVGDWH